MSVNGNLLKLKCAHSPLILRILSSTSVPFTLTTMQVLNLALTHTKRIAVHQVRNMVRQSCRERALYDQYMAVRVERLREREGVRKGDIPVVVAVGGGGVGSQLRRHQQTCAFQVFSQRVKFANMKRFRDFKLLLWEGKKISFNFFYSPSAADR